MQVKKQQLELDMDAWHSKSKAKQTLEVNGWDLTLTMDFLDSRYI